MDKGIIYLIQPCELVGTNRFKVGMSGKTSLDRCIKGYKKGSRYLAIMECDNPAILESQIKNSFNKKFNLIGGSEYFEGDEKEIVGTFLKLFYEFNDINININVVKSEKIVQQIKKYKCDICGKEFNKKWNFEMHSKRKNKCYQKIVSDNNHNKLQKNEQADNEVGKINEINKEKKILNVSIVMDVLHTKQI